MSAAGSILRYQGRELTIRWKAQPASPLARWFLTFALAAAAGILLLGFAAAESARRIELRRLGLDTIVIQAPAESLLSERSSLPADHWAAPLENQGELLLLQQLPEPAYAPWGDPMPVFVSGMGFQSMSSGGPPRLGRGAASVWFTRTLPPGRRVRLTRRNLPFIAVTAAPDENIQALGLDDFIVLPVADADERDATGRLDVVLFRPRGQDADIDIGRPDINIRVLTPSAVPGDTVDAVRRLFAAEGKSPPILRDPAPYRAALDAFTRSQNRWRTGMALILCLCVVLAFGSIGMLEEKQTRYTQALLRSLGVSGGALWSCALFENLALANTALLAALIASQLAARAVLALAGAPLPVPAAMGGHALLWLACAVNSGVLLSLMPLAKALRRPVGTVLP